MQIYQFLDGTDSTLTEAQRKAQDRLFYWDADSQSVKSVLKSSLGGSSDGTSAWQLKSANYLAINGDRIIADTSTSSWTLTLPANPTQGNEVEVLSLASVATNNLLIEGLSTFEGKQVVRLKADKPYKSVKIVYINPAIGWVQNPATLNPQYPAVALNYVSNGDANGAFYYIGTNKNSQTWSNPYTANRIGIFYSSFLTGQDTIQSLVDRQPSYFHTNTQSNPFIGFELLADKSLVINYWSYRARSNDPSFIPNRFILSGSNDGTNYTQLSDRSFTVAQNNWVSFPVASQTVGYRYFRFLYPATAYFTAGEFELYGDLVWN